VEAVRTGGWHLLLIVNRTLTPLLLKVNTSAPHQAASGAGDTSALGNRHRLAGRGVVGRFGREDARDVFTNAALTRGRLTNSALTRDIFTNTADARHFH
jgi:hypothetical protein